MRHSPGLKLGVLVLISLPTIVERLSSYCGPAIMSCSADKVEPDLGSQLYQRHVRAIDTVNLEAEQSE